MKTTIRMLSLWNPWAHFLSLGMKRVETRSWKTEYRGPVLIHASSKDGKDVRAITEELLAQLPQTQRDVFESKPVFYGGIVAIAHLAEINPTTYWKLSGRLSCEEQLLGDYGPNLHGWLFTDIKRLDDPISFRGRQGLCRVDKEELVTAMATPMQNALLDNMMLARGYV